MSIKQYLILFHCKQTSIKTKKLKTNKNEHFKFLKIMSKAENQQVLPHKEAELFKLVVVCIEI